MKKILHCQWVVLFILALLGIASVPAVASDPVGHVYVALKARDQAPESTLARQIIDRYMGCYLLGSSGPDIAYIASYNPGAAIGEQAHYQGSGELIHNMMLRASTVTIGEAAKLLDVSEDEVRQRIVDNNIRFTRLGGQERYPRERLGLTLVSSEMAFTLGWLTHYATDSVVHPLINQYDGMYPEGKDRHTRLELVENTHLLTKAESKGMDLKNFELRPFLFENLSQFVYEAFVDTYSKEKVDPPRRFWQRRNPDFKSSLEWATQGVAGFAQFVLDIYRGRSATFTGPIFHYTKGSPPTQEEYQLLMTPMVIEEVELQLEGTEGELVISYTINDIKLYKAFIDAWDRHIGIAVEKCVEYFYVWENTWRFWDDPFIREQDRNSGISGLEPNLNLETGFPVGTEVDTNFWPGDPNIQSMWLKLNIADSQGRPLLVGAEGWASGVYLRPDLYGIQLESPPGWNWIHQNRGEATIPFSLVEEEGSLIIEVELYLADENEQNKKLYGSPYGIYVKKSIAETPQEPILTHVLSYSQEEGEQSCTITWQHLGQTETTETFSLPARPRGIIQMTIEGQTTDGQLRVVLGQFDATGGWVERSFGNSDGTNIIFAPPLFDGINALENCQAELFHGVLFERARCTVRRISEREEVVPAPPEKVQVTVRQECTAPIRIDLQGGFMRDEDQWHFISFEGEVGRQMREAIREGLRHGY